MKTSHVNPDEFKKKKCLCLCQSVERNKKKKKKKELEAVCRYLSLSVGAHPLLSHENL